MNDQHVGQLTFVRVYSGTLNQGTGVYNSTREKKERIGRLLRMHANKREDIDSVSAGDIAAVVGLKDTRTGDTLCDPGKPVVLEAMDFPTPVIAVAIEPKTKADEEKLGQSLARLAMEDPTFKVNVDPETNQTLIHGMGELHLEIIVDRLLREFKVEANVGKPQVAYRETVRQKAEAQGRFVRQTGGRGQYGDVWLEVEPGEPGSGVVFENELKGPAIPREYVPAVEKGIKEAAETGVLAGYPVVDVRVALTDGSYHEVDSNEMAFKIAASMGFKEGCRKAKPVLLEPVMDVEVVTPLGVPGGGRGRPQQPPRQDPLDGGARQRPGDPRQRAARPDVRLRDRRALDDPGTGHLYDAVRPLRGSAPQPCRRDHGEEPRRGGFRPRRFPLARYRRENHGQAEV